jgi:hypothetical protein
MPITIRLAINGSFIYFFLTAEAQRLQSFIIFSFSLRGRKAKILKPPGIDDLLIIIAEFDCSIASMLSGFHLPSSQRQMKKNLTSAPSATRAQRAVKPY